MTYQDHISRILLSFILLIWAVFCVSMALNSSGSSISALFYDNYRMPAWISSFLYFGMGAIFAWASLSALLSKNWQNERFQIVALAMSTALGVAMGFAGITPQSELWHLLAQVGVLVSLACTAITAGFLLSISSAPYVEEKLLVGSNDNYRMPGRRTASNAQEIAAFQALKDGWLR